VTFPFVSTRAAAQELAGRVVDLPPSSPGQVVHHHHGKVLRGGQVAHSRAEQIENARRGGSRTGTLLTGRRRWVAVLRRATGARQVGHASGGGSSDDGGSFVAGSGQPPAPRAPRDCTRRDAVLVEDYVEEALVACIRRSCGLPSTRAMTKQAAVVTARVFGDKNSRSRAIVLRQGGGKRDSSILWVSSRDGFLCSCFSGHENALLLSTSSRSTTCSHTVVLRKALSSSGVSSSTFCSRMRLRADAA